MTELDVAEHFAPFESASELRESHAQLLEQLDRELALDASSASEAAALKKLEPQIRQFVGRGTATGVFLEDVRERTACTALLEYWVSSLSQIGRQTSGARLARFDREQLPDLKDKRCPFVGLEAFRDQDQAFFFGREADTANLAAQVRRSPLVVVVGASGSGKSSLVMSGVLPTLAHDEGPPVFRTTPPFVPGNAVLDRLADAVTHTRAAGDGQPGGGAAAFRQDPGHLCSIVGDVDAPIVITIDQFEEVFTLSDSVDREALAANLARLLDRGRNHRVILTMREEFRNRVVELRPLAPYLDTAWYAMSPMGYDELRTAVEKPAALVNLHFQLGIVDDLVKKVLGQAAALPLLQFTLRALWDNRDRNRITWEVYTKVGDPLTALKTSADDFYDSLAPQTQDEIKRVLLELVRVDELLEAYRQPVPKSRLLLAGKANTEEVLQLLADRDYIRVATGERDDDVVVEVKHESLIRNWPRYVSWIDEKRLARRQRLALTEAASRWAKSGRPVEQLLTGWQLHEAEGYTDLPPLEREFVQASAEEIDRSRRERENQLLKQRRRAIRLAIASVLTSAALASIFLWLWWVASSRGQQINALAELAGARSLAETDPTSGAAAILLAVQRHALTGRSGEDGKTRAAFLRSVYRVKDEPLSSVKIEHQGLRNVDRPVGRIEKGFVTPDGTGIVVQDKAGLAVWGLDGQLRANIPTSGFVAVAVDVQGGRLIGVSEDGSIRWLDMGGKVVNEFRATAPATIPAFSGDARRLMTAVNSDSRTPNKNTVLITVRDSTGQLVREIRVTGDVVDRIVSSPDGSRMVTLGSRARLWDVSTASTRLLTAPTEPQPNQASRVAPARPVKNAYFSPDSRRVVTVADDEIWIWSAEAKPLAPVRLPVRFTISTAFSPDGRLIATVSSDGTVQLWNAEDGSEQWRKTSAVTVTFNRDGSRLVTTSADGTTRVWDTSGILLAVLSGHRDAVVSAAFDASEQSILTVSADGTARLWSLENRLAARLIGHTESVRSINFSPDASLAVTASSDHTALVWNLESLSNFALTGHTDAVAYAEFSPDGQHIVTASYDGTARIWRVADRSYRELKGHNDWVLYAAFSPIGRTVVTSSGDNTARLWSLDGAPLATLKGHTGLVHLALFSPDGQRIVTASDDVLVRLWDLSGRALAMFDHSKAAVHRAEFSTDGKFVLTVADDSNFRLWDLNEKVVRSARAIDARFSADGRYVLVLSPAGTVAVDDVNGKTIVNFKAGPPDVVSAELSRDGQFIITVGRDGTIRFWNLEGQRLAERSADPVQLNLARLSPDRQRLLTVSAPDPRFVSIWPLTPAAYASRASKLVLSCLTSSEMRESLLFDETEAEGRAQRCTQAKGTERSQ